MVGLRNTYEEEIKRIESTLLTNESINYLSMCRMKLKKYTNQEIDRLEEKLYKLEKIRGQIWDDELDKQIADTEKKIDELHIYLDKIDKITLGKKKRLTF